MHVLNTVQGVREQFLTTGGGNLKTAYKFCVRQIGVMRAVNVDKFLIFVFNVTFILCKSLKEELFSNQMAIVVHASHHTGGVYTNR